MAAATSLEPHFLRAHSVQEAIDALQNAKGNGIIIAGGIVVCSLINQRLADPQVIVDISAVAELRGIYVASDGALIIGMLTTHHQVLRSPLIAKKAPLLAEIARDIACDRLRRRGTLGGSVCTVGGQGDPATGLIALKANIHLRGPDGQRVVMIEDFYKDAFTVDLSDAEIAACVHIPAASDNLGFAFCKLAPRGAMDWTQITAAVTVTIKDNLVFDLVIGMNGIGATPLRPRGAEETLRGRSLDKIDWTAVGTALDAEIAPEGDTIYSEPFKRHLALVCLRRTFERAKERAIIIERG